MSCRAGTGPALPLRDAGDHAAATVTATATGMGTGRRRSRTHALMAAAQCARSVGGVACCSGADFSSQVRCQRARGRCAAAMAGPRRTVAWSGPGARAAPVRCAMAFRGHATAKFVRMSAFPVVGATCHRDRAHRTPGGRGFVVLRGCTRAAQVSVRAGQRTGNGPGRGSRDEAGAGSARITINRTSHNAYYVHERRTAGDTSRSLAAPRGRRDAAASGSTRTGALPPGLQWLCSPGVRPTDRLLRPQLRHSGQPAPA